MLEQLSISLGSQQLFDDFTMDIGETKITTLEAVGEFLMIESQQMEHGSMKVVHMDLVCDGIEAEGIRFADGNPWFDPAAGKPH